MANNNLGNFNLSRIGSNIISTALPNTRKAINLTKNLTPNDLRVITFYSQMDTEEKEYFKTQITEIVRLNQNMRRLGQHLDKLRANLKTAGNTMSATLKNTRLDVGNTSFRGRSGPTAYLSSMKNSSGKNTLGVAMNFLVNGRPYRVTNTNSFNAALAKLKKTQANAVSAANQVKKPLAEVERLKADYNRMQVEITKLVKDLQKAHIEYKARAAKEARKGRTSFRASTAPVNVNVAAAQSLVGPVSPPKTGFMSRFFGRKGGATRKRRGNRKTRKAHRRR